MTDSTRPGPKLYLFAWTALGIGLVSLAATLLLAAPPYLEHPFFYFASALIGGGCSEILNHPKKRFPAITGQNLETNKQVIRERNPCGLGNLLAIGSIILFFVGIGKYLANY